ncbi:MAG: polysaccharide biosynthesis tyrosine autokinase, partial [Actinomycetota bacterium]
RELVQSEAVAALASDELDGAISEVELLEHVSVSVPTNSQILDISYTAPDPLDAQRAAQAFATGYIGFKRKAAVEAYAAVSEGLDRQVGSLEQQLQAARRTADRSPDGSTQQAQAENEVASLLTQIGLLQSQIAGLQGLQIDPGTIVQQATLPTSPSSPNHVLNATLGLLLGLALGIGLAFVRERLDERLRGREDLEQQVGAPALVTIPKYRTRRRKGQRERLIALDEPKGSVSESYRALRTTVQFLAEQAGARSIMIASAIDQEGKTTTAANLAVVLAQAGKRVILLSGDLRKPKLNRFFNNNFTGGAATERGLTNVIAGDIAMQDAIRPSGIENLRLVLSGPISGSPAEVAASERMAKLLGALRDGADFTIIDTAPLLLVTDALAMAPNVDAVLLVASAETDRGSVARARVELDQVGANVIGAVLNKFDPSKAGAYGYRYTYRYSYRYAPEVEGVAGGEGGRPRQA